MAFNTVDNIGVLAENLNANGVQLCAITDHDAFGFDMYKALKAYENDAKTVGEEKFQEFVIHE